MKIENKVLNSNNDEINPDGLDLMQKFEQIKSEVNYLDEMQTFVKLEKKKYFWSCDCPFNCGKKGSFTTVPEKGRYYCYSCTRSGDLITFVAQMKNINYLDAAEYLIKKYNLSIEL
jgi:DNA primase